MTYIVYLKSGGTRVLGAFTLDSAKKEAALLYGESNIKRVEEHPALENAHG